MPKYTCNNCHKEFNKKDSYNKHLNRKIPCTNKKMNLYEAVQNLERKVNHFDTMSRITNDKELKDLWENLHHLLWSSEGFTPEKAMDHLILIFYIRLIEPRIEDGSFELSEWCKFNTLANITDPHTLWEKFTTITLPELANHSPEYFSQFGIKRAENLYKLIGHINRIDLEHTDRDFLGHIFEYIIGRGTSSMSDDGQYFTNRPICSYAMELVNPVLEKKKVPSMIDPFCGTGGFITEYVKYISKQGKVNWEKRKNQIFGVDVKIGSILTTLINLMFCTGTNFDPEKIVHKNSFYDRLFEDKRFDFIFTNPPFGGDNDKGEQFRFKYAEYAGKVNTKTGKRAKGGKRIKTLVSPEIEEIGIEIDDKVCCAVMLCMSLLSEGGTACMVLPEGFVSGKIPNSRVSLRKKLIEEFDVKYVVVIPAGSFENTKSTSTHIVIFQKGKPTSEVEFIDFTNRDGERTITTASLEDLRKKGYSLFANTYVEHVWNLSDEYKLVRLGDMCEINPESYTKKDSFSEINYVDLSSITNMKIESTTLLKVGTDKVPSRAKRKVKIGDTLIGTVRPNLRNHCFIDSSVWSPNTIVSTGFCVLRPKDDIVLPSYLFYQIYQDRVTDIFSSKATGTSYPAINTDIVRDLQIPLPSLKIQQEWVSRIDRYRDMSIQAQKLVDIMEQTAMSEVKATLRHPDVKMVRLGDVCEFNNAKKHPTSYGSKEGNFIFHTGSANIGFYTNTPDINHGIVIINRTNGSGKCNIFYDEKCSVASQTIVFCDKSRNNVLTRYLYYFFSANIILLEKGYQGGNHKNITVDFVKDLQIPLPPLHVQNELKPLFDHISSLKSSIKIWNDKVNDLIRQLGQESQKSVEQEEPEHVQIIIEDDSDSDVIIEDGTDEDDNFEILKTRNCKELRDIAKKRNISGRSKMNKKQLIEAIMN